MKEEIPQDGEPKDTFVERAFTLHIKEDSSAEDAEGRFGVSGKEVQDKLDALFTSSLIQSELGKEITVPGMMYYAIDTGKLTHNEVMFLLVHSFYLMFSGWYEARKTRELLGELSEAIDKIVKDKKKE